MMTTCSPDQLSFAALMDPSDPPAPRVQIPAFRPAVAPVQTSARLSYPALDAVTRYAVAVVQGDLLTNTWVRLACRRHLDDLRTGRARGLRFNLGSSDHAIQFFREFLLFYEGEWNDIPFVLQPWQEFIVGSVFGWQSMDPLTGEWFRRFRTAYIEAAKGCGKSPLAAGIGLYGIIGDAEPGAEIYSAAVTREQAGIVFRDAHSFAEGSDAIRSILTIGQHRLTYESKKSFFSPVSSEHRGLDGKRPHIALIDEIHEHPDGMVVDKIRFGTKGRRQAMIFEITNAGYDRQSICYQHHEYSAKILQGLITNESWFAYMTGLDVCSTCASDGNTIPQEGCPECDDWRDESVWIKANPNLGISIKKKYIHEQVSEAIQIPSKESLTKRLNFCIWTESAKCWLPADAWTACTDATLRLEDFSGRPCYVAFDLANKIDISALIQVFLRGEEELVVFGRYYLPEDTIKNSKNSAHYRQWVKDGYITMTSGAMTDYAYIEADLEKIHAKTPIIELAFDPHEATYLVNNVMQWLEPNPEKPTHCIELPQRPSNISEPMKQLEGMVYARKLHHPVDPVLAWMISNVVKREGRAGGPVKYYYPTKDNDDNKIDGPVAMIMAVGRAKLQQGPKPSVYETRGVITF